MDRYGYYYDYDWDLDDWRWMRVDDEDPPELKPIYAVTFWFKRQEVLSIRRIQAMTAKEAKEKAKAMVEAGTVRAKTCANYSITETVRVEYDFNILPYCSMTASKTGEDEWYE